MSADEKELYDATVEAARRETESGLDAERLQAVHDSILRARRLRPAPRASRGQWFAAFAIGAVAMLATLLIWPRVQRDERGVQAPPVVASVAVVVHSGELRVDDTVMQPGTQSGLETPRRARLAVGKVSFVVHARGDEPFRVEVGRAELVVYAARFSVFAEEAQVVRLEVTEGAVDMRVEGETHRIEAGEIFTRPAVAPEPPPAKGKHPAPHRPAASPGKAVRPVRVADGWEPALASLRDGKCDVLRTQVEELVRASQFAEDKAQALLLNAECAVRKSDKKTAVALYASVAREYPWASSAETALFEVATLQSEVGTTREALASADAYVQRYPQGRFIDAMQFRRCELVLRSGAEARGCFESYLRDFPNGVKASAAADYLRRAAGGTP